MRRTRRFKNEPGATLVSQVAPDPLCDHQQPMLKSHKQIDMDQSPEEPGRPAFDPAPTEIEHGRMAADDCGVATILELEGRAVCTSDNLPDKCAAEIGALLLCDLRQAGECSSQTVARE